MDKTTIARVVGLGLCALGGWLSLRLQSVVWLLIAMGSGYLFTLPLRQKPKPINATPERKKGHV